MTPEQLATLSAISTVISNIGAAPIWTGLVIMMLTPWIVLVLVVRRIDEMATMYANNIILVKGYEKLAGDLTGIIHLNTQAQTRLIEKIENNMSCPAAREAMGKK